jgi:hypothetical protein
MEELALKGGGCNGPIVWRGNRWRQIGRQIWKASPGHNILHDEGVDLISGILNSDDKLSILVAMHESTGHRE